MRLAAFNVNGLRAAERRGVRAWLDAAQPDIVGLQEVRCPPEQVPPAAVAGYAWTYDAGTLAGRNGVALLSRTPPAAVRGMDEAGEFAHEGRYIEADFDLPGERVTVASLYLPKGAVPSESPAAKAKHERKLRFCALFEAYVTAAAARATAAGRDFAVVGDFNIARTPQDLHNNRSRQPLDGFLPDERDWLTGLLDRGLVDVVRRLHPDVPGPYSWWSWRGQAWALDRGWRIDYHLATPGLAERAAAGGTERSASYEARVSDHAPVVVDYPAV
ncbi:MAG: exodeoxyribonuclease III [Propionibacteriaceae bacterium]|jgi:exodeoxyribonuclease-3|nr:exodeoxyribonuclease III [Propionibacteriaceae bacterium]